LTPECLDTKRNSCRKNLNVVELPTLAHLDSSLKEDLKFHARFLAMHVAKMKRDIVLRDKSFNGDSLKE
jgi:hypothetical protein